MMSAHFSESLPVCIFCGKHNQTAGLHIVKTSLFLWLKLWECHVEILCGPRWFLLVISKLGFWHSGQPLVSYYAQIPGRNGKQAWWCCPVPTYQHCNLKRKPYYLYWRGLNSRRWQELPFLQSFHIVQFTIAPSPNNARGATLSAVEQFQLAFFKTGTKNSSVIANLVCVLQQITSNLFIAACILEIIAFLSPMDTAYYLLGYFTIVTVFATHCISFFSGYFQPQMEVLALCSSVIHKTLLPEFLEPKVCKHFFFFFTTLLVFHPR